MRLNEIQTFIIVVEAGNFSKAADKLDVSAMAISKQINHLEQSLGVSLFERSTRKMQLTDIGKLLFEQFKDILTSLEKVSAFIASIKNMPAGTLNITSMISIGETFLIPYLTEFMELYPNLKVQLKLIDLMPDFSQEKVDIAVGYTLDSPEMQMSDLKYTKLLPFKRKIYASKAYLKKHGHPKNLKQCEGHQYIEHYYRSNDEFLEQCKKNKIELQKVISTNSMVALLECCADGVGLASIADYIVEKMPSSKKLVALENLIPYNTIQTYIFYRNLRFTDPKILCFKEFFKKKFLT